MDKEKDKLATYLAELKFVHEQMHVRMTTISRLVILSMTFYTIILTSFIIQLNNIFSSKYYWLLILAIFPFLLIAILIGREDFLMLSHDKYLMNQLRPRILELLGEDKKNSKILIFLRSMSDGKIGAITSIASVCRYAFSILGISTLAVIGALAMIENLVFGIIIFGISLSVIVAIVIGIYEIYKEGKRIYSKEALD